MIIDVYKKDFKKDVEGFGMPNCIDIPSMPCQVQLEISGDVDDGDYNILRDRLKEHLDTSGLADKLCVTLYKLTKSTDELVAGMLVADEGKQIPKALSAYQKEAQKAVAEFESNVSKVFIASWKKFIEDRQKYKTYKTKAAIDFVVNLASLAGSVASLAASATPAAPVTAVMGIYGILKNSAKLAIQIRNLYIEAETLAKDVEKDVATLKKKYDKVQSEVESGIEKEEAKAKKEKRVVKVKELAVVMGNKMFGDVAGMIFTSVETTTKKNSQYGNKIRGIQEETRKFAKDYIAMTDHMDELYKYVRKLDDDYSKYVSQFGYSAIAKDYLERRQKKIKKAFDAWNGATKAMKGLHEEVEASEKRYQTNLDKQKELQKVIDDFEAAFKTKNWAVAGRWLGVAADVGLAVGPGGAGAWEGTNKIIETSMKLVVIAEKEAITEIKDRLMK